MNIEVTLTNLSYRELDELEQQIREKKKEKQFEDFLCEQGDKVTNAAHDLICALTANPDHEWDMSLIGPIIDQAIDAIEGLGHGEDTCYPFHSGDGIPCYKTDGCGKADCPFREKEDI